MATTRTRTKVITIRIDDAGRDQIDRPAAALGKGRAEFVLDAATREAQSVLSERRFFQFGTAAFRRFNEALDLPPADNPCRRQFLAEAAPWER